MAPPPRAHAERLATTPDFLPRSGASAVAVGDDVLLLCGYEEERKTAAAAAAAGDAAPPERRATNGAHAFSARDLQWRALPVAGDLPTPRLAAGAVELGGSAYLIGGWAAGAAQGADAFLADVWRLAPPPSDTPGPWRWQRAELAPGSVDALGGGGVSRFACAAVSPTRAILHTHRCGDHVVALDVGGGVGGGGGAGGPGAAPPAARLSRVPVLPDPQHGAPPSRGLQSMTLVVASGAAGEGEGGGGSGDAKKRQRLLVFGGAPQKGPMFGDLWALDGDFLGDGPLQWTRLWAGGGAEEGEGQGTEAAPHVRCSHVAADVDGGLLVLGGSYYTPQGSLCPLDDAWWFDASAGGGTWRRVALGGGDARPPAARNAAVLAPLPSADPTRRRRFLYHGGWRPFVETYDDSWILRF
jgi:hypothetical protein